MKMFLKRSFWAMLTVYLALWLVISLVAGVILEDYKDVINASLGLTGFRTETINTGVEEDLEYFKSNYIQVDENGDPIYVIDENGYKHQVYDDIALKADAVQKAYQVQREGSTILWNNADNGLPLAEGDKVSLFSHSSADWVYSGFGSGIANTTGSSNMNKALTNAGLSVNKTLWDFYRSGAGKSYIREERIKMNEVPWSEYTDAVKNSFSDYGDAAIIVLSRRTGEKGTSGDGALTRADTPSGSYYDLSVQEREMIKEVVALKKAGTFKKVIVLLNTATDIWFAPIFEYKDEIDCCLWVSQTGQVGLDEVGNILAGKSIPSGHLPDTFLMNSNSNPATVNFVPMSYTNANTIGIANAQWQSVYTIYMEGIYLGYKYYETRYEDAVMGKGNATSTAGAVNSKTNWVYSEEVAFPFGYGAAYTEFQYSDYKLELGEDGNYNATVTVTNIGNVNGKDAVQIYVQKPYTEYDKEYGIEQAAVNLAGYAKTPELKPGESVTISIMIRDDALKTYDANNKKTYIREAGDYYFVVAHDAHDAVNNILAAKGYTPENTNGVMDAEGNIRMVEIINFAEDDFTTYSVSEHTGKPITNQFDNVDWNKYALKTEGTVTYLSRNDWQATYPTQINLALSKEMLAELGWNKEVAVNPGDKMPLYGQSHVFNLIDLRGLPYDHSSWDTILNQMTLDEQIALLANGYHGTKEVISVAKPAEATHDGPLGIRQKYKTNSSAYTMSYPNNVLLAASFNDQLAYEVGYLIGEDMLHTGVTGVYGPGANIHRSTYSGRNYEYYSEDGFLSGIMAKQQIIGIQETGCYVNMKHFVLNDAESNRHGVGTWANEQSIREIYLQAFEYAITEGGCTGLMSAFNRLGTLWSGAHKGLTTEVLRNEWGFNGFVISDAAWREYMGVVEGVMAGNDCILGNVSVDMYSVAEKNPSVALAIRESVHRILYVVANGNAMNGFSSNTRIYEVDEWWQILVKDVQTGLAIATAISFVITLLAFIFLRDMASNISTPAVLKIVETVIAIVVALAIGAGSVFVSLTLPGLPTNFMAEFLGEEVVPDDETGGETEKEPSLKDQLEGELTDYIFEVECSENTLTSANLGNESNIVATNYPSGGQYAYNLSKKQGVKFTFNVTSASAQKAVLSVCMGQNQYVLKLADMFAITVNGVAVAISEDIEFTAYSGVQYYDWTEKEAVIVDLVEGANVIELTQVDPSHFLNFDYIALTSAANLQWTHEVGVGHSYDAWSMVKEPTLDEAGELQRYCNTCRALDVAELPIISEENGYAKNVIKEATATTFGSATWTYQKDGQTYTFITTQYPEGVKEFNFEADQAKLTSQSSDGPRRYLEFVSGATESVYIGKTTDRTWTLQLIINSDIDCEALFVIRMSRHNSTDYKFNDGRTLTVNGEKVVVSDDLVINSVTAANAYYNWDDIEIAVINLKAGKNVIEFSNAGKPFNNIDYFKLVSIGELGWYVIDENHVHTEQILPGKDATCVNSGLVEGKYCTECEEIIVANDTIPALGHTWDGTTCTRCNAVKFEAENSIIDTNIKKLGVGIESGQTLESVNYPSGDAYVYKLSSSGSATFTFTVNASKAGKAVISFCFGLAVERNVSDIFHLSVNGTDYSYYENVKLPSYSSVGVKQYYGWYEIEVADIDLVAGVNTIVLTKNTNGNNFDYIAIRPVDDNTIGDGCSIKGHSYVEWTVDTMPTYATTGKIISKCEDCSVTKTVDIPTVSVENGYTLVSTGVTSLWKYTYDGREFEIEVEEAKEFLFEVTDEDDVFASIVDNNGRDDNGESIYKNRNSYGIFYELIQGATFTIKITASEATEAVFALRLNGSNTTYAITDILSSITVTSGGNTVSGVIMDGSVSLTGEWTVADATMVELATVSLQEGENVITFTMGDNNINMSGVQITAFGEITHEPIRLVYGSYIKDYDPFVEGNGGSVVTNGSSTKNAGSYYEKNQKSEFTFTVNVDKPTEVKLVLALVFGKYSYNTGDIVTSVTSANSSGAANTVTITPSYVIKCTSSSWKTDHNIKAEFATILLSEGMNTITFTFGDLNVNIFGVFLQADNEIVFGTKQD